MSESIGSHCVNSRRVTVIQTVCVILLLLATALELKGYSTSSQRQELNINILGQWYILMNLFYGAQVICNNLSEAITTITKIKTIFKFVSMLSVQCNQLKGLYQAILKNSL